MSDFCHSRPFRACWVVCTCFTRKLLGEFLVAARKCVWCRGKTYLKIKKGGGGEEGNNYKLIVDNWIASCPRGEISGRWRCELSGQAGNVPQEKCVSVQSGKKGVDPFTAAPHSFQEIGNSSPHNTFWHLHYPSAFKVHFLLCERELFVLFFPQDHGFPR